MHSTPLSRLLFLAVIGAVVVGWASAASPRGSAPPYAAITQVSGELQLTNSRQGQTIFEAERLTPGRAVTGTVRLSNTGTLVGDLSLEQVDVVDQPGANGGRLSGGVELDIEDVTGGGSIPIYEGPLAGVGTRALGKIGPGEGRTYRFIASLPDTGPPPGPAAGDNAYAGSRVSVRYRWTATAPDSSSGTDGTGETGGTGGTGETGGTGGTGGGSAVTRPRLWFRVDARRVLTRGWIDVLARCNRGCSLDAWAEFRKVRGARVRHRLSTLPLPGKTARIRLKLSKRTKRALVSAVRTRRPVVRVKVKLLAAGWSQMRTYTKTVSIKPPKPRRR
jgi:hypothetical protein